MYKQIDKDSKIFQSEEFQKDKYKFSILLNNLNSETLELYSDEEDYVVCRSGKEFPTWVWTKDNFDKTKLKEIEEVIDLFRLDVDVRYTCKKELYNLLKEDYEELGDYYFEMGYLVCNSTVKPRETDGYLDKASIEDIDLLTDYSYKANNETADVKKVTIEEARKHVLDRLNRGNYYVWKNNDGKIVAQAEYKVIEDNAKVGAVYTVPSERNKGYAASLIYELTNDALGKGYHVSLYTDYSYPASNKAYKNVGYVDEDVLINFSCNKKNVKSL